MYLTTFICRLKADMPAFHKYVYHVKFGLLSSSVRVNKNCHQQNGKQTARIDQTLVAL